MFKSLESDRFSGSSPLWGDGGRRSLAPILHVEERGEVVCGHQGVAVVRAELSFEPGNGDKSHGQFSNIYSGEMGPAPGRFELSKGILK